MAQPPSSGFSTFAAEACGAHERRAELDLARGSAASYDGGVPEDPTHFRDVVCSFCGRHNREVRVVANDAGLIICQVCVATCAKIFDDEVGVDSPQEWAGRWPLKR